MFEPKKFHDAKIFGQDLCRVCRFLPIVTFFVIVGLGLLLHSQTVYDENQQNLRATSEAAQGVKTYLETKLRTNANALKRMANRISAGHEYEESAWRHDAKSYVNDVLEFKVVEWINSDLVIQWLEPEAGNEKAKGLQLTFEQKRRNAVFRAVYEGKLSISELLSLVQGGRGFLIYAPAFRNGKFFGIAAGVCNPEDLFSTIPLEYQTQYNISATENNIPVASLTEEKPLASNLNVLTDLNVHGAKWTIDVSPRSETFLAGKSSLPTWILFSTFALALLGAFAVLEWVQVKQLAKQQQIQSAVLESNIGLLEHIFDMAPVGMVLIDPDGNWCKVNKSFCTMLGYSSEELLKLGFKDVTHPDDIAESRQIFDSVLRAEIDDYSFKKRFRTKSGHVLTTMVKGKIVKTISGEPVYLVSQIEDISEQVLRESKLREESIRDPLTGLFNRRKLDQVMSEITVEFDPLTDSVSVIMLDIDKFKGLNDKFGHAIGDLILKTVSELAAECCGENDLLARYGGEEFAIFCTKRGLQDAENLAEAVRLRIERFEWPYQTVTASFGVAQLTFKTDNCFDVLKQADSAMYSAKANGRNQVVTWSGNENLDAAS